MSWTVNNLLIENVSYILKSRIGNYLGTYIMNIISRSSVPLVCELTVLQCNILLLLFWNKAGVKRRTSHEPNGMQMKKNPLRVLPP